MQAHSYTCYYWSMDDTRTNIANIDEARRRRRYIALANANPAWLEIVASFRLSGIKVTERQAVRAGRMIAGEVSFKEICDEIHAEQISCQ
jgi:hypothetical protein